MPTIAETLRKEGIEIGLERGDKRKAREVARKMILDNQPIEMIKKYSGLSLAEIDRLKRSDSTH